MAAASVQAMEMEVDSSQRHVAASSSGQTVVNEEQAEFVGAVLLCGFKDYPSEFQRFAPHLIGLHREHELKESMLEALGKMRGTKSETIRSFEKELESSVMNVGRLYLSGNNVGSLLEFLDYLIAEKNPNSHIVVPYVELLLKNAKGQENANDPRVKAKRVLERAIGEEEASPLLLETLFTYFLSEWDDFAVDQFAKYCRHLAKSRVEKVKKLCDADLFSKIEDAKNIRQDSLIKVALGKASNVIEALVSMSEKDLEEQVSNILSESREKVIRDRTAGTIGATTTAQ